MKTITLPPAILLILAFSCAEPHQEGQKETPDSTTHHTTTEAQNQSVENNSLFKISGNRLSYPEFEKFGAMISADYSDGRLIYLTDFTEKDKKSAPYRPVALVYEGNTIRSEIRTYNDEQPSKTDTLNYVLIKDNTYRAKSGGVATDITLDASGNILQRINYGSPDADNVTYYYAVQRDEKGNEKEAILAQGESDIEVQKITYEYLESDRSGNWRKRIRKVTRRNLDYEAFQDHFSGKKKLADLEFPVKAEGTSSSETEERTIEYK